MTYVEWKKEHEEELNRRAELMKKSASTPATKVAELSKETIEYLNECQKWFSSADDLEKAGNYFGADSVRGQVCDQLRGDGFDLDQLNAMGWNF